MPGSVVVVTGTGTGVGKTHLSVTLLRHWATRGPVCGFKPGETGVEGGEGPDARQLREASSFHVQLAATLYAFPDPVSPHLAARRHDVRIDPDAIVARAHAIAARVSVVVVELAGGLFSPLATRFLNADLVAALSTPPSTTMTLLVAPDRLGVLHDVTAATRAASAAGVPLHGVVLMAPELADTSTGTNASELAAVMPVPVLASLPRRPAHELAMLPVVEELAQRLVAGR